MNKKVVWLEYCQSCKRKHRVTMMPCPSCEGRGGQVPQPVSDNVANTCTEGVGECEGCETYRDHLAI